MTLDEYNYLCRLAVREPVASFFTDEEIMSYINLKSVEFIRTTLYNLTESVIAFNGDLISVDLPADYLAVDFVLLASDSTSTPILLEKRGGKARSNTSKLSPGYRIDTVAGEIILTSGNPVDANAILTLSYAPKPLEYSDPVADIAIESDVPHEFAEVIVNGATSIMFQKQERFPNAGFARGLFTEGMKDAKRFKNKRAGKQILNINA